jgi:hypothetical protein
MVLVALVEEELLDTAVGDGALGRRPCAQPANSGVDVSHVPIDPKAPTGQSWKDPVAHWWRNDLWRRSDGSLAEL